MLYLFCKKIKMLWHLNFLNTTTFIIEPKEGIKQPEYHDQ